MLPSIGNEVLKATVAQFNADQLLTMRDEVSKRVSFALRKRAEDFGIVLEDVALTHLSFGIEYSRAIEAKQVSQQEAERSKFVVLKSEQERKPAIIRAEGESESARLINAGYQVRGAGARGAASHRGGAGGGADPVQVAQHHVPPGGELADAPRRQPVSRVAAFVRVGGAASRASRDADVEFVVHDFGEYRIITRLESRLTSRTCACTAARGWT